MAHFKAQRIRDPLHNLIEFEAKQFDNMIWELIQTQPFQRLRRIKQLGFSENVYPGATHTRFAHSIGVFHTARRLTNVIKKNLNGADFLETQMKIALVAALLHDVGHGPFSHAFEDVTKKLGLSKVNHEAISEEFIEKTEIKGILSECGIDSKKVAKMLSGGTDIYGAVVSSQFDADRLDYMRRDRLMTGSCHGRIDFEWLLANLEVGEFSTGVDEEETGKQATFIIGSKAEAAAESYVLGLFQFYPAIYFHKTTRGMEKLFSELLLRIITLATDGDFSQTNLPAKHPLIKFAKKPEKIENILNLDDSVIIGALPLLKEAKDDLIREFSERLWLRKLYKVIDVYEKIEQELVVKGKNSEKNRAKCQGIIQNRLKVEKEGDSDGVPQFLIDEGSRSPYKKASDSKSPLNQIRINTAGGETVDLGQKSKVVKALKTFSFFRVYVADIDSGKARMINQIVKEEVAKI